MSAGRTFRRCTCKNEDGRLLGQSCPRLSKESRHGVWYFAVDQPGEAGRRKLLRRGGFTSRAEARRALDAVNARAAAGVRSDDRQTVAEYLRGWLDDRRHALKPATLYGYQLFVENDLIPALGHIPLESLRHEHVAQLVTDMETRGRGAVTITRMVAALSSALSAAVRQRRLTHNVAKDVATPRSERTEFVPWSAAQAAAFLEHAAGDDLAELFEVLMGTGLRRGEAFGLRWSDVDLSRRVLRVRRTVSEVNGRQVTGEPKTRGSAAGVGLSQRVVDALTRQRARQNGQRLEWGDAYEDGDLVFARANGAPLRAKSVLGRFHRLSDEAGLPRVRLHDLRHLAATLMITAGVPLALVSKTLRHSRVGITVDLYGHLTEEAAQAAADSLGAVLDGAAADRVVRRSEPRELISNPSGPTDAVKGNG